MTSVAEMTLTEFATVALDKLREEFPAETLLEQQVMCVATEGGELLDAYRRWKGLARRPGLWTEVRDEIADVLLASYVTALLIDADGIKEFTRRVAAGSGFLSRNIAAGRAVRRLNEQTAKVAVTFDVGAYPLIADLVVVAAETTRVADLLDVDLEEAWRAKAEKILNRPWREEQTS